MALLDDLAGPVSAIKTYMIGVREGNQRRKDQAYQEFTRAFDTVTAAAGLKRKMFDLRTAQQLQPYKKRMAIAETETAEEELKRVRGELEQMGMELEREREQRQAEKQERLIAKTVQATTLGTEEKIKKFETRAREGVPAKEVRGEAAEAEVRPQLARLSVEQAKADVQKALRVAVGDPEDVAKAKDLAAQLQFATRVYEQGGFETEEQAWSFVRSLPEPVQLIDRFMRADQVMQLLEKDALSNVDRAMALLGPEWGAVQPTKKDLKQFEERLRVIRDNMALYLDFQGYDLDRMSRLYRARQKEAAAFTEEVGREIPGGLSPEQQESLDAMSPEDAAAKRAELSREISPSTPAGVPSPTTPAPARIAEPGEEARSSTLDTNKMLEWAEQFEQQGTSP